MARPAKVVSRKAKPKSESHSFLPTWADDTELVGLLFDLEPTSSTSLYSQYTIGLHA